MRCRTRATVTACRHVLHHGRSARSLPLARTRVKRGIASAYQVERGPDGRRRDRPARSARVLVGGSAAVMYPCSEADTSSPHAQARGCTARRLARVAATAAVTGVRRERALLSRSAAGRVHAFAFASGAGRVQRAGAGNLYFWSARQRRLCLHSQDDGRPGTALRVDRGLGLFWRLAAHSPPRSALSRACAARRPRFRSSAV